MKEKSNRLILVLMLFFVVLGALFIPLVIEGQREYSDSRFLSNPDKQALIREGIAAKYGAGASSEADVPYFNALVPLADGELMLAIGKVYDFAYTPHTESGPIPLNKDGVFTLFYPASEPADIFIGDTLLFSGEEAFLNASVSREVYPATRSAQMIVQAILLACAVLSFIPLVLSRRREQEKRSKLLLWLMSVNAGILTLTLIGFIATMHYVTAYERTGNGIYGMLQMLTFVVAGLVCVSAMILHSRYCTFQHRKTTFQRERVE